jgi:predicted amidohydrolase YtcJ
VVTMAAGARPAGSMLVRDGQITAVGLAGEVRAAAPGASGAAGRGHRHPGPLDGHCHITDAGYPAKAADCSQPSALGIPAIQAL